MSNKIRVAVYCRVGFGYEDFASSNESIKKHYDKLMLEYDGWEYIGFYIDDGGTKTSARPALKRLLRDCRAGKIDMVITRSMSMIFRNVAEAIECLRGLHALKNPVGVYFEDLGFNSACATSAILAKNIVRLLAGEECKNKHNCLVPGCQLRLIPKEK